MNDLMMLELGGDEQTGTGVRVQWNGEWPPPETVTHEGKSYRRVMYSSLPPSMPNIIRGAKYEEVLNG